MSGIIFKVELKIDKMDLTKAESKATYEEIKSYVLEHTGLKVSYLFICQVENISQKSELVIHNRSLNMLSEAKIF